MKTRLIAVCIAAALAGCTTGPNYVRPIVEMPPAWRIDYPKAADVANLKWWEQFGDPVLNELVETALRDNRDLSIAAARVDQFIGTLTSTGSQLYPQICYGADASRVRASAVGQPPLPPGANPYFSLYSVSLGASWQTDLFGQRAPPDRGCEGQGLRQRARPTWRRTDAGVERGGQLHRAARTGPVARDRTGNGAQL